MTMVVVALMTTFSVNAQNSELKNEISISYGASVSTITDGIGNAIGNGVIESMTGREWANEKQFGSLSIEYFHHLSDPKVAVGVIGTFCQYGEDVVNRSSKAKEGERTRNYFTVMPSIKYAWINKDHFALYSKAAIGLTLEQDKQKMNGKTSNNSQVSLAFQFSAIGVEFGGKFRGFVEAGVGEQGIVLAGLRYKF